MWINGSPFGIKKIILFLFILILCFFSSFYSLLIFQGILFFTIIIYIIYFTYLFITRGFQIKKHKFKQNNQILYITDTIFPLNPSNNSRTLVLNEGGSYSSVYLHKKSPWKYFDLIRKHLNYYKINPKTALVLGGGLCSVPRTLIETFNSTHVDVLENDTTIIALAKRYVLSNPVVNSRITIHNADAKTYMFNNKKLYDVIFVDVFNQQQYCPFITSEKFITSLQKSLSNTGIGFVNFGFQNISDKKTIINAYKSVFKVFTFIRINNRNYLGVINKEIPKSIICDVLTAQKFIS